MLPNLIVAIAPVKTGGHLNVLDPFQFYAIPADRAQARGMAHVSLSSPAN